MSRRLLNLRCRQIRQHIKNRQWSITSPIAYNDHILNGCRNLNVKFSVIILSGKILTSVA